MADSVVYRSYARTGQIWGMTTVQDQQMAGAIMKLGEAAILWMLIAVLFLRWALTTQANDREWNLLMADYQWLDTLRKAQVLPPPTATPIRNGDPDR